MMWIYVPLGRIDYIWVREDDYGLALVVRATWRKYSLVILTLYSFELPMEKYPLAHIFKTGLQKNEAMNC